jgi:hypothetical protein
MRLWSRMLGSKAMTAVREFCWIILVGVGVFVVIRAVEIARLPQRRSPVEIGTTLMLTDSGCESSKRSLFLATSANCVYCSEDGAFHDQLLEVAAASEINTVVLLARNGTLPSSLRQVKRHIRGIHQVDLAAVGVPGTPTVLLTEGCKVVGSWVGRLGEAQRKAVLGRVRNGDDILTDSANGQTRYIRKGALASEIRGGVILDIRNRDALVEVRQPGATNIPLDELALRAFIELPLTSPMIVDCSTVSENECNLASVELRALGVQKVLLLNRAASGASCRRGPV